MQFASDKQEDSHIITACNANKKLSFQGWEECVEAFSQGKGHLSYRCSQLMSQPQQDMSHLDAAISWSSSDEECEDVTLQQMRQRPNRLLSSQINFDDCKPVRKKGRRHSSALFVRSIEKRHEEYSDRKNNSLDCGPYFSNQQTDCSNVHNSTVTLNEISTIGSEPLEHVWVKNVSILNQRINIFSDCSETFPLTEKADHDTGISSPVNKGRQKSETPSPILRPYGIKNKKTASYNHRNEIKEEGELKVTAFNSVPNSPVFKTSSYRRRSKHKTPHTLSDKRENDIACDDQKPLPCITTRNSNSEAAYKGENLNSSINEDSLVATAITSPKNRMSASKSPKVSKKTAEIAVSPVIGKSSRKRPRPVAKAKMVIDQSISPILGSKSKPRPLRTSKLVPLDHSSCSILKEGKEKIPADLDDSFNKLSFLCKPPVIDTTLLNDGVSEPKPFLTQSAISAKRSLDFSHQSLIEGTNVKDCDTKAGLPVSSAQTANTTLDEWGRNPYQTEVVADEMETSREESQALNHSTNYSHLIEEINTEQFDYDNVQSKPVKTPVRSQKQKKLKLSLKKKKSPCCEKKEQRPIISVSKMANDFIQPPTVGSTLSSKKSKSENSNQVGYLQVAEDASKWKRDVDAERLSKSPVGFPNRTLFIEEELSEPMDMPLQDVPIPSVDCKDNSNQVDISPTKFDMPTHPSDHSEHVDKCVDDVADLDITSCSSQSPEGSQQTQIEKLPSSCVSSPLTISQSSSPPAPAGHRAVLAGNIADDFNAPPKKGKKKLKPDGLASRLQRLLNRQRSSSRIWQYQRSKRGKSNTASADGSDCNSSMFLIVERKWTEYSHVLVQGYVYKDVSREKVTRAFETPLNRIILVIDTCVAEKIGRIMSATKIQIFPPWQGLKLRGVSVILCAYCIEVVSSLPLENLSEARKNEVSIPFKEGFEGIAGVGLSDIIFPKVVEKTTRLFQCTEVIVDEVNENAEDRPNLGTISALVSSHYTGSAIADGITLTVLRIFHFRQVVPENQGAADPSWSLLGQDVTKEVCEVILGCERLSDSSRSIWQDVRSGQVIGKTYTFFGFLPIQRIAPFRVSNLWKIVSSMDVLGPCEQPVLYMLAAANSVWECKPSEREQKLDIYQPHFTSLISILSENFLEPRRVNLLCRLLHVTNERLYFTDVETCPKIVHVTVNPAAYLSPSISRAAVIAALDLEVAAVGDLKADKYTRISAVHDENLSAVSSVFNEEHFRCLADLNPDLPVLQRNTPAKSLVNFFGAVVGVDEESAYMWPACGICENELLSFGNHSEKYRCEKCNDQSDNFTLRMSLQVLCTCPSLPQNSSVRLKLLQSTIESLLPPTVCGEEGYDMNAVLGQKLGPLRCEVINSKDYNFVLQEFC